MRARRPSLRLLLGLYLVLVHLPFALYLAAFAPEAPVRVLVLETVVVVSAATGVLLLKRVLSSLEAVRAGATFLAERDFSTRLVTTGRPEVDDLVDVYNRMTDALREERIRLEERQQFLSKLLEASPTGVVTFDYDGNVSLLNPRAAALLGVDAPSIVGRALDEAGTPFAAALAGIARDAGRRDARIVPLGGSRRVKVQRSEFLDRGFARAFLVLEELTEEIRLSEKAAYEKLIRMMSHEVNNSLAAAGSLLESCLAFGAHLPDAERSDFERALRIVIDRGTRLGEFMRELAELAKIPPPRRSPGDVDALADGVSALMREAASAGGVALERERDGAPGEAVFDRRQMEQALVNVVKNGLEAAGAGGRVVVRTGRRAGRPYLEVEDSGPGLADEARSQLFRPFFTTKEHGQGVGLTVAREVLAQHGFDFSLEAPSGGPTRFTIVLA